MKLKSLHSRKYPEKKVRQVTTKRTLYKSILHITKMATSSSSSMFIVHLPSMALDIPN